MDKEKQWVKLGYVAIYALGDCRDLDTIRYAGQAVKPEYRFSRHMTNSHGDDAPKDRWVKQVLEEKANIACFLIEWVVSDKANDAEAYWINELQRQGHPLTNYNLNDARPRYGKQRAPVREYTTDLIFSPRTAEVINAGPSKSAFRDVWVWQGRLLSFKELAFLAQVAMMKPEDAARFRARQAETIEILEWAALGLAFELSMHEARLARLELR